MIDDPDERITACAMDWVFNRDGSNYQSDWPLPPALAAWLSQDSRHFQTFTSLMRAGSGS